MTTSQQRPVFPRAGKPVAVFQHTQVGAPGAVMPILQQLGLEIKLIPIFEGADVPESAGDFAGLVFMGGSMAATDPLPWIAQELALIRDADRRGLPVAGHCLGSQLIATAFGGTVRRHHRMEIGWGNIRTSDTPRGREWWGAYAGKEVETFQWHSDAFAGPDDADVLASSQFCHNQVFVVRDRHMLVQSHLEITPALIEQTLNKNRAQLDRELSEGNPAAQPADAMLTALPERTGAMHAVLHQLYSRWSRGCAA